MSNIQFSETFYLSTYPDVASAVSRGEFASGQDHYNQFGRFETRDPNQFFDTSEYLGRYPDVAASGLNPFQHFLQFGAAEGRFANSNIDGAIDTNNNNVADEFDSEAYLAANPDVDAAVRNGSIANAFQHFALFGQFEGRSGFINGRNGSAQEITGPFFDGSTGNQPDGGTTLTLTDGLDNLIGTNGADTFVGDEETFNSGDTISGLGGEDTLRLFINTDSEDSNFDDGDDNIRIRTTSVENIEVEVSGEASGGGAGDGLSFDLGSATGVQSVASVGSENDVTFESVQDNAQIRLEDTDANLTVNFDNDALGGSNADEGETVNVQVANVGSETTTGGTSTATFSNIDITTEGDDDIGTLTLDVTGEDENYLTLTTDGDVSDLVITGAGRLVMEDGGADDATGATADADSVLSNVETIDASANTGGVALDLTANTENLTFTGGSGDDLVVFDADSGDFQEDDDGDTVDGGAGDDILVLDVNDADDISGPGNPDGGEGGDSGNNVIGFEHLGLTGTATDDVSIDLEDGGFQDVVLLSGLDVTFENTDDFTVFVATDDAVTLDFESTDDVTISVDRPEALEEVPDGFGGIDNSGDGINADVNVDLTGIDTATFISGENDDSLTLNIDLGDSTDTLTFSGVGDVLVETLDDAGAAGAQADDDNLDVIDLTDLTGAFSNAGAGQEGEQTFILGDLDNPEGTAGATGADDADGETIEAVFNFDDDGDAGTDLASLIDLGGAGTVAAGTSDGDADRDVVRFTTDFNSNIAILNFNSASTDADEVDGGQIDILDFTALGVNEFLDLDVETINQVDNGAGVLTGGDTLITSDLFEGRVLLVGVTSVDASNFDFTA